MQAKVCTKMKIGVDEFRAKIYGVYIKTSARHGGILRLYGHMVESENRLCYNANRFYY